MAVPNRLIKLVTHIRAKLLVCDREKSTVAVQRSTLLTPQCLSSETIKPPKMLFTSNIFHVTQARSYIHIYMNSVCTTYLHL